MTKPPSKTKVEPSNVMPVTLDNFEGEDRKAMEEYINELTREALMRATTRTHQGVIIKPRPRPKLAPDVSGYYPGGQTGSQAGPTAHHDAGQTGPWAGQTGTIVPIQAIDPMTNASYLHYFKTFDPPVSTATSNPQVPPHIPNAYNDVSRGYPPDTRQGQYNHIAPQTQPIRPLNPPPNQQGPNNLEDIISDIMRNRFGIETRNRAKVYQKPYPDYHDNVPFPRNYRVPEFTKFSGEDSRTTWEHESRVDDNSLHASLDDSAISCIAEPSNGSDCGNNLCNNAIEDIAELNDGSDCITSESEIASSPKTESQIGHMGVGKDDDNVLRDSSEIESKVAMYTYQRPYPEHVDSVPYPQGFEVPNFTKFTGEDARTTMEHIGQFIDQCGKAGSNDLLKLKLFPLSLSNFASTWYSLLAPNSISTWSQMEHEFHDYFKDASLMEQRPIDTSSVTCETISVTSIPKTGIVSDSLPVSPIDVDKKKGKSVIIGDPRPRNRIKNAKAEDHKVTKDESSSIQRTKKPQLTFEMLMAKYKKGLAGQRFDNQISDSKRPRSSRRKRFGQTSKQSELSTIPTPVVMPWSGGSKVKKFKKVWVRKEAKAREVVAAKEGSQDVHVPTGDAVETKQAKEIEADAVTANIRGLTETAGRSNRQSTAGLTDLTGRSDRRLVAGLTGPRGRSDRRVLQKSGKIESNIGASTSTKNMKNHCFAPGKQPQPKWIPSGLSRSKKRRLQRLRAIGQKEKEAEDVENKTCNNLEPQKASRQVWRSKEPMLDFKSLDEIGKIIDQGRSNRHCTAGLTGGSQRSDRLCMAGLTGQIGWSDRHCVAVEVNLVSLRYFKQDDLSVEDYKTLMGSNFEDVIDKRLKTLKERKTLQDGVFRGQLMENT
uniref:Retrotransposon protein, putative, Ty3-gypsy subclass n=2 Tax=Oryza sativa subsp. japonica TaxID=39947 RepID=A0A5S6R788_ORYSJ|nr:Hypothetical protein [Oryza sativa]AAP52483.1 retrotransposon protein, putative, Ty3-gypsy subclass [Oryza sativa Japonica Group]